MTTEANRRRRALFRFLGCGYVVFCLVAHLQFEQTAHIVAPWFNLVGAIAAFVPGIALVFASSRATMQQLTRLAYVVLAGYFLAIALWFVAYNPGGHLDSEVVSWLTSITDLPPLVALLIAPFWQAGLVLVASVAARIAILTVGRGGGFDAKAVIDSLNVGVFGAFFLLAFAIALRSGQLFDDSRLAAIAATSRSATAVARNAERSRFDGVVHDRVLAVLNAVRADPHDARLPEQARTAIAALDEVSVERSAVEGDVSVSELLAQIRTAVVSVDDRLALRVTTRRVPETVPVGADAPTAEAGYPAVAVRAISEATAEALRNSIVHAGTEAARAVLVEVDADTVSVAVVDDGVGFDQNAVSPERLGLRVSVVGRMARVAGGSATITTARGEGTVVEMLWSRL